MSKQVTPDTGFEKDEQQYVTPPEAAAALGCSGTWIRVLCRSERIPGAKQYGRSWLIPRGAKVAEMSSTRPLRIREIP